MKSLEAIFPPKIIPAKDIKGTPLEVFDYMKDFGGKAWNQVPELTYCKHTDVFSLMDHSSLVYFIAGFLKIIKDDPYDELAMWVCFFAATDDFIDFCKLLSEEQVSTIWEILEVCLEKVDWTEITAIRDNMKIILNNKKHNNGYS